MTEPPDPAENKILAVLKGIAFRVGLQILILFAVAIVGWVNAANNATQVAKDESANRRISGVEAAISDLPDLRQQVAMLNQNAERGRADRIAFQERADEKLDALRADISSLTAAFAGLAATVDARLPRLGTPGPPPAGLSGQ